MLKTLLKKQFMSMRLRNRKTGLPLKLGGSLGFIAIYGLLYVSVFTAMFGISYELGEVMVPMRMGWLLFAMMALISVAISTVVCMFMASSSLYIASDNDLLLAMPIKPGTILLSRMIVLYLMNLLLTSVAWLPCVFYYAFNRGGFGLSFILGLVTLPFLAILSCVLSCILGYVVAYIAKKFKNNSAITTFISLAFLAGYYYVYFNANKYLQSVLSNLGIIEENVRSKIYLLYLLGNGALGDIKSFLIATAILLVIGIITYVILSRTFLKVAIMSPGNRKKTFNSTVSSKQSPKKALLMKELKRFTSSSAYMLNCGLGIILVVGVSVYMLIEKRAISDTVVMLISGFPILYVMLPAFVVMAIPTILSMIDTAIPAVSLEGKEYWIIRSLPVATKDVLHAKSNLQILLSGLPILLFTVAVSMIFNFDILTVLALLAFAIAYVLFSALICLFIGLKTANLDWTHESVPIKQNIGVMIGIFGQWILGAGLAVGYYFLRDYLNVNVYILLLTVLLSALSLLINSWINGKGVTEFENLNR